MREEFSPFSCRDHMIYYLSTEGFVFLGGVGAVEDAVFDIVSVDTSKTIFRFLNLETIENIVTFTNNAGE
jgi:hypothetical protein